MPEVLSEQQAYLVLNSLPGIGPITLNRMLAELGGDPRCVLSAKASLLERIKGVNAKTADAVEHWREHFKLEREEERLALSGCHFITCRDPEYPPLLREIHDPPIGLYRQGSYACQDVCVAIVGSRRTTLYGQSVAKTFGEELARSGFCVSSGLARGIDTAAHEGALAAGGRTVAALGTGIDIIYPAENLGLQRRIAESGAVFSEFPFGRRADRQSFAMRNRIVAGMSRAVVVIESDVDGGAMITARFAGEQGRLLCAVPGRIDQATSAGCHQLIRDGATLVTCVDDVLEEMNYLRRSEAKAQPEKPKCLPLPKDLDPLEKRIMEVLSGGEMLGVDALAEQLQESASAISVSLMTLELKTLLTKHSDGRYERR
jgi:DNA processing protein